MVGDGEWSEVQPCCNIDSIIQFLIVMHVPDPLFWVSMAGFFLRSPIWRRLLVFLAARVCRRCIFGPL
jgi:hypothetical protein